MFVQLEITILKNAFQALESYLTYIYISAPIETKGKISKIEIEI